MLRLQAIKVQIDMILKQIQDAKDKAENIIKILLALALAKIKAAAAHALLLAALAKLKISFALAMAKNLQFLLSHVKLQIKLKLRLMLSMLLAKLKFKWLQLWKLRLLLPKFKLSLDLAVKGLELGHAKALNATAAATDAAAAAAGLECFPPPDPALGAVAAANDPIGQSAEQQRKADCDATHRADTARAAAAIELKNEEVLRQEVGKYVMHDVCVGIRAGAQPCLLATVMTPCLP